MIDAEVSQRYKDMVLLAPLMNAAIPTELWDVPEAESEAVLGVDKRKDNSPDDL